MRIPRFFLHGRDLENISKARNNDSADRLNIVEPDLIHRIKVVLRLRQGAALTLLDDTRCMYRCLIDEIAKDHVSLHIEGMIRAEGELAVEVEIAQSVIKGDRFEWALEKLTELGAGTIVPMLPARGVVMPGGGSPKADDSRLDSKMNRWKSIIREAAEQSERARQPQLGNPISCSEYLSRDLFDRELHLRYICAERSDTFLLTDILKSQLSASATGGITSNSEPHSNSFAITCISIAIGPEGGFTPQEISIAQSHGWQAVSLGRRILRSETAGMCAMAQIASLLDC